MKPTLRELHQASMNGGQLPASYFQRVGINPDPIEQKPRGKETVVPDEPIEPESAQAKLEGDKPAEEAEKGMNNPEPEAKAETVNPEFPRQTGDKSPWWELSNGKKVMGEDKARAAQAKLEG